MGLNCQPGRPRQVATRAVTDISAYSIAISPYHVHAINLILAMEAYDRLWAIKFPGLPIKPAIPELLGAVSELLAYIFWLTLKFTRLPTVPLVLALLRNATSGR